MVKMKTLICLAVLFCSAVICLAEDASTGDNWPLTPGGLIHNEDCSNFFCKWPAEKMNIAGLRELIDQYDGTQITHIFLNGNAQCTSFDSKVCLPLSMMLEISWSRVRYVILKSSL